MNEAPAIRVEPNPNGRGYLLWFRPCHKIDYAPVMKGDAPRVFNSRVDAAFGAVDQITNYGWGRMTGTQDGIAKRHTVEAVFGKGA